MKRSHICPKCGGRDILRVPGKSGAYGAGNNIQMGLLIFFRRAGPPVCLLRLRLFGRMDRRRRPERLKEKFAECSGRKYDDIPSENRARLARSNRLVHRQGRPAVSGLAQRCGTGRDARCPDVPGVHQGRIRYKFTIIGRSLAAPLEFTMGQRQHDRPLGGRIPAESAATVVDFTEYVTAKKFWMRPFVKWI